MGVPAAYLAGTPLPAGLPAGGSSGLFGWNPPFQRGFLGGSGDFGLSVMHRLVA